jgi:hypothetical protein
MAGERPKFYGAAGLKRNPRVGGRVRLVQNDIPGVVLEERISASGNAWRVRCDDGYEAWFPENALCPNEELS